AVTLFEGGMIIASYTWSQDSTLWGSLGDNISVNLALENIDALHSTLDIKPYHSGHVIKHWCQDNYSHGAFTLFTPFQEHDIMNDLVRSINVVRFGGEYTSSCHGWIEGDILSALRVAMIIQEELFDVVIVGGGPIGLTTAIQLAKKEPNFNIAIIEQYTVGNMNSSDQYLAELAIMSVPLWRNQANLSFDSILNTDDEYLFFGNTDLNKTTTEGNLEQIQAICEQLDMNCKYLNNSELRQRFLLFAIPINIRYQGIYHSKSGYVNVSQLFIALMRIIQQNRMIIVRENEEFLSLDMSVSETENYVRLITNRGSIKAKKVLFVPGPYAKNLSSTLGIDLNIKIWELPRYIFLNLHILR
ncbi:unnamed protein product, partial [Didymodactylos carnosus]